jgi:2-C-methyl-D-erythritol 4-phosphate cytidylyltransferase/2-C-methyl-D-erythritol 2,4-cyclodiphosphate synthase
MDKLLVPIGGRPLLIHTLEALASAIEVGSLVVVTTSERRESVETAWAGSVPITFVEGGARRQDSVRAGFEALDRSVPDPSGRRVVLVHDGARPAVAAALVTAVVDATARFGAAIPVVPVVETIKRVTGDLVSATVDRAALVSAQTPQGIQRAVLREALASPAASEGTWTDEAALLEVCRIPVHVVPGDPANLKVTVTSDLARVAEQLGGANAPRRTGIGHDGHPFGPGEPLHLGGLEIPGAPKLHGHSDGDVVLHAIADALLGAAGMGDLGQLFPAGPSTPRGADSRELLAAVVARLAGGGWQPVAVDLTVTAARPRLGRYLDAMRGSIAGLLALDPEAVSVKASTGNLEGSEGAGRGVSTLAIVTIEARS